MSTQKLRKKDSRIVPEIKKMQNWVCWKYEERDGKQTKIPINPHNGQYASSADPDTWSDLDTARHHNEKNPDTTGVGVVFSDDDFIAGIDLDNVRDPETGEIEPWAQDVIERADSYTEVSPSGTGIHILVYGMLPPEGRTRKKQESTLDCFDDSEIEMYDSGRFFTATFDHVEGTPQEVQQRKDDLQLIHDDYVAENDDDDEVAESDVSADESDLDMSDQELLQKAKNAENGQKFRRLWDGDTSMHEDDHSRADLALMEFLAYWTQCDKQQMERLFSKSGLAQRDKWQDRDDYRQMTVQEAVDNCDTVYDPDYHSCESESNDGTTIPSGVRVDVVEKDGRYFEFRNTDDGPEYDQVTNFTLETEAFITDHHDDEEVEITVHPASEAEDSYKVIVPWTVFNETRKFTNQVVTGRTTTFTGGKKHLADLRLIASHQDVPELKKTKKLGLHDDSIVTTEGNLGVDKPEYRYVDTGSAMETKWGLDKINEYDEDVVADILELLPQTRESERILTVLGWWYASLLTPYIRNWESEVPFLGVFGETGIGKSTLLENLSQLIGKDTNPSDADTTKFSLIRQFSATTNIPVWFDEYKPSDMKDWVDDVFKSYLRKATKGADATRGNADMGQDRYKIESPVVVSGEQSVKGSAENRRMIPVTLSKQSISEETKKNHMRLTGGSVEGEDSEVVHYDGYDMDHHARAIWGYILDLHKEEAQEKWFHCKEAAYEIKHQTGVELEDLELVSIAMVKFGLGLYRHFSDQMGAELTFGDDDIQNALRYIATESGTDKRTTHVEEFLSLASTAARDGEVFNQYAIINEGRSDEELLLKLDALHHKVSKYVQDHSIATDLMDSHDDYKDRLRELADADDTYVNQIGKRHRELNRCVAIDPEHAAEVIDGFDREAFL
jgi:primase-polymerase (primpol)-like protein/energy-coupling factor transporter ATP-binding protein EcfA2